MALTMLDRTTIDDAKLIIQTLLHEDVNKIAFCYRRTRRRDHHRPVTVCKDKLLPYVWERVTDSSRECCWAWEIVLINKVDADRLPDDIPIWEDDPKNGRRSLINTSRDNIDFIVAQSDAPLISALMGERLSRNGSGYNDPPVWEIKEGQFLPIDVKYCKVLIGIKTKIKKERKFSFHYLLHCDATQLDGMGFTPSEISVLKYMRSYR